MRKEEIRRALRAEPFVPFTLTTTSGREYPVAHPEMMALAPTAGDRSPAVYSTEERAFTIIDLPLIELLSFQSKRNGRRRRSA